MKKVKITTQHIKLGQFLKLIGYAQTGGELKQLIQNQSIYVNKILEKRRGRKLFVGDKVEIAPHEIVELI